MGGASAFFESAAFLSDFPEVELEPLDFPFAPPNEERKEDRPPPPPRPPPPLGQRRSRMAEMAGGGGGAGQARLLQGAESAEMESAESSSRSGTKKKLWNCMVDKCIARST